MRSFLLVVFSLAFIACAHKTTPNPSQSTFIQGTATVLQVDNTLGTAVLSIDGQQTAAYWDTDFTVPQDGMIASSGPFQTPVGDYREQVTHHIDLPAKAGDTIRFRAMKTGTELMLRYVQVVSN